MLSENKVSYSTLGSHCVGPVFMQNVISKYKFLILQKKATKS